MIDHSLTSQELALANTQASSIAGAARATISTNKFVFFAAFDGTNNDRNAIHRSGNPLDTNVAQLEAQVQNVSAPIQI